MNLNLLCRILTHVGSRTYKTGVGFACSGCEGAK